MKNNILMLTLFASLLIFISCNDSNSKINKQIIREKEDNNSFAQAQAIEYGIQGNLSTNNDVDYFIFEASKEQKTIDLLLSSEGTNSISMTLFNFREEIIKNINEPNEINLIEDTNTKSTVTFEQIIKNIYMPRHSTLHTNSRGVISTNENAYTYYILIDNGSSESETPYTLTISERDYKDSDEREPNDRVQDAQLFVFSDEINSYKINGYYSQVFNPTILQGDLKGYEIDAYKMSNGSYSSYMATIDITGVPSIDTAIRLYDSKAGWITIKDNNIEGDGEIFNKILMHPNMSYYFILTYSNANNVIPYQMDIIAHQIDEESELEPNNKDSDAQSVNLNKTYRGAIDYSGDSDYFSFNVPLQSVFNLSYFMIDSQALNITLSNATYGKIDTMPQTDDRYSTLLASGIYYLIIDRDRTKEGWKKGESKPRGYEFKIELAYDAPIEEEID